MTAKVRRGDLLPSHERRLFFDICLLAGRLALGGLSLPLPVTLAARRSAHLRVKASALAATVCLAWSACPTPHTFGSYTWALPWGLPWCRAPAGQLVRGINDVFAGWHVLALLAGPDLGHLLSPPRLTCLLRLLRLLLLSPP